MIHDSYRWIVVAIIMLMIKRLTYTRIGRFSRWVIKLEIPM